MINLKPIYNQFKKAIQFYIKGLAEENNINPLQVLASFDESKTNDLGDKLENIGKQLHDDYGLDPVTAYEFFENFKSGIYDTICPDWNSTIENESFNTYLNKRLKDEGYSTIPFEVIDFLFDEIQQWKPIEAGNSL